MMPTIEELRKRCPASLEETAAMYADFRQHAADILPLKTYYFSVWKQADDDYKRKRRKNIWKLRQEGASVAAAEAQAYSETADLRTISALAEVVYTSYNDVYFNLKANGANI